MTTTTEFVISRSPVQAGSPAPVFSSTYGRSVGTAISSAVVLLVLLGLPGEARAEGSGLRLPASVFLTAQALDVHSTHLARSSGNGIEANPLMNVGTGGQIAIKAVTTAGVVFAAERMHRRHPALAKGMLWTLSAVTFTIAARNYSIARAR